MTEVCTTCPPALATYGVGRDFDFQGDRAVVVANARDGHLEQVLIYGLDKTDPAIRGALNAVAATMSTGLQAGIPAQPFLRELKESREVGDNWGGGSPASEIFLSDVISWLETVS